MLFTLNYLIIFNLHNFELCNTYAISKVLQRKSILNVVVNSLYNECNSNLLLGSLLSDYSNLLISYKQKLAQKLNHNNNTSPNFLLFCYFWQAKFDSIWFFCYFPQTKIDSPCPVFSKRFFLIGAHDTFWSAW